jgi:signal transduction histidine kinase
MSEPAARLVRILHLEDDDLDSELIVASLRHAGLQLQVRRARTPEEFTDALRDGRVDLVLSDFSLPGYDGMAALRATREVRPDLPFVLVSGTIGEERAVAAMKLGATDYVLKDRVERLPAIVERALRETEQRRRQEATERTLADVRQRMEFALDAAQVGIWEWDFSAGTVVWSTLTESLHGFAPGTFAGTFDAALAHIHPDDRARVQSVVDAAGGATFGVEYRVQTPAGVRWVTSAGRVWQDDRGQSVRASGISRDSTAQRSLEDQLRQAQRLESIGQLAAGIAHDFNNLMNVVLGYSELLTERFADVPDVRADVAEIERAARSATGLTRQLLAFSRRQILTPTIIDLNDVVRDTQKMMRRVIEENIRLEFHCSPEPLPVKVDVSQMEQVLLNLVVNARDAMPEGGTVTIETREALLDGTAVDGPHGELRPGPYALLSIADTGTGIPAHVQPRLFEPFFTTKAPGRGTGLGLATVYGIVKQSGGHIAFESALGVGTTFRIYVPLSAQTGAHPHEETVAKRTLNGQRILVVEDQPALSLLIEKMLSHARCEVLVASSAEEARQLLVERPSTIDLVLTDIVMRGQSGYSLAKWIAEEWPRLPVIFMTGYSDTTVARQNTDEDLLLLQKPFSRETLISTIERALSR